MRKSFAIFFLMLCGALSWAQNRKAEAFIQEGTATAALKKSGMIASHPSLPMGSRLMVKNQASGKEVEVTINGRIPASFDRIIDLSPEAAGAINLDSGGPVVVYIAEPPAPLAVVRHKPAPLVASFEPWPDEIIPLPAQVTETPRQPSYESGPVKVTSDTRDPMNITLNIQITNPPPVEVPRQGSSETHNPELNWLAWLTYMATLNQGKQNQFISDLQNPPQTQSVPPPVQYIPPQAQYVPPPAQYPPPQAQYAPPPAQYSPPQVQYLPPPVQNTPPHVQYAPPPVQYTPPPAPPPPVQPPPPPPVQAAAPQEAPVRIVSVLPDPAGEKLYRLQIGAFSTVHGADRAFVQLRGSGFEAAQEQAGSMYRVLAVGIPASQVYNAIQRLGVLGFREVWVRD